MTTATSPGGLLSFVHRVTTFGTGDQSRDAWSDPYVSTYRRFRTMVESWVRLEKGSRAHSHQAEPGIHPLHGTQPLRCVRMCNLGFVQQYMVADPGIQSRTQPARTSPAKATSSWKEPSSGDNAHYRQNAFLDRWPIVLYAISSSRLRHSSRLSSNRGEPCGHSSPSKGYSRPKGVHCSMGNVSMDWISLRS